MLAHTDLVITAWDDENLVGFGRMVTDFVFRASIWDVIVDRLYHNRDIGKGIVHHAGASFAERCGVIFGCVPDVTKGFTLLWVFGWNKLGWFGTVVTRSRRLFEYSWMFS